MMAQRIFIDTGAFLALDREGLWGMKATGLKYTILLERNDEGGYTVTVPSLPGCITQGATWDEALVNGREAIAGYLDVLRDLVPGSRSR
jgi:predicted RNase H-like HicB family nuclease